MPGNMGEQYQKSQSLTQNNANKAGVYTGRVVEDKKPNSREIKVFIKDLLPYYSGDLKPKDQDQQVGGGTYQGTQKTSNYVTAEWMGDESNRRFPPDVKVNEQVEVIIYADQDKIFWRSKGRDDDKRRTERIELNAANTPQGPAPVNRDNSYSISMDTQDKQEINIQTSKSGGEEFAYVIKINAKDGKVHIADDANNEICIESKTPRVYMRNKDNCLIDISQKNITIIAVEDFLLKAGRQAIFDIPSFKMVNTNKAGVTVWESAEIVFKAQSAIFQVPCIGLQGNVEANNIVSGNHYATGYSTIGGGPARSRMRMARAGGGGSSFSTYKAPSIDIFTGVGQRAGNSPNIDGGFTSNRHCTAWEDISNAVALITADLQKIDGIIGYGNNAGGINSAAASSIMQINTGL